MSVARRSLRSGVPGMTRASALAEIAVRVRKAVAMVRAGVASGKAVVRVRAAGVIVTSAAMHRAPPLHTVRLVMVHPKGDRRVRKAAANSITALREKAERTLVRTKVSLAAPTIATGMDSVRIKRAVRMHLRHAPVSAFMVRRLAVSGRMGQLANVHNSIAAPAVMLNTVLRKGTRRARVGMDSVRPSF